MKKLLYMAVALMVSMASVTAFTACGDDDDDDIEDIINGTASAEITENGNTATLKITQPGAYTATHVAQFNEQNVCTSYVITTTYSNSTLADVAWEAIEDQNGVDGLIVRRDGKSIIVDYSEMDAYKNGYMSKALVMSMLEQQADIVSK